MFQEITWWSQFYFGHGKYNYGYSTSPLLTSYNAKDLWGVGRRWWVMMTWFTNSSNIPEDLLYFSNYFFYVQINTDYFILVWWILCRLFYQWHINFTFLAGTPCPFSAAFLWLQCDTLVWMVMARKGNAKANLSAPWVRATAVWLLNDL